MLLSLDRRDALLCLAGPSCDELTSSINRYRFLRYSPSSCFLSAEQPDCWFTQQPNCQLHLDFRPPAASTDFHIRGYDTVVITSDCHKVPFLQNKQKSNSGVHRCLPPLPLYLQLYFFCIPKWTWITITQFELTSDTLKIFVQILLLVLDR